MLTDLSIEGLGAIASATTAFSPGLTVVTGETGAGKTMVVTSLHLLSGARADAGRVRAGAAKAIVEGRFSADTDEDRERVSTIVDEAGGEPDEDGSVIAVRTVAEDGRSRAFLGGRAVPAATLAGFTAPLLTVHGQNDQLRLLRGDQQLAAIDRYAASAIAPLLKRYRRHREAWLHAAGELADRLGRERELSQEADRLTFGLSEIDAVAPEPGEDRAIVEQVRRLSDLDSLRETAELAHELLGADAVDGRLSALDALGQARDRLEGSGDDALRALGERLAEAVLLVGDVHADVGGYLADLPADPAALDTLLERQAALKSLTRKYAEDVDAVLAWAADARARLAGIDLSAEGLETLRTAVESERTATAEAAAALTAARHKAAAKLAKAVTTELRGLAMGKAQLQIDVRARPAAADDASAVEIGGHAAHAGSTGTDEIEFLLVAHDGAKPLPLARSASGGELSRVMLALEVVLAGAFPGGTMVFDEVDAGVGGRAAVEIGKRLARLARDHQVIVVTHLPQVAAFADAHLVVDKTVDAKGSVSGVVTLDDSQRVHELARMLAGLDDTETGRAHAEELLETARAERRSQH